MKKITSKQIANMVGGEIVSGEGNRVPTNVVIDSREVTEGSLFVALRGESTDGHRFLPNAYQAGAKIFLVSDLELCKEYGHDVMQSKDVDMILVSDALKGLQDLASRYLDSLEMDCVAVTGSVGKTTTRDMLSAALSSKYNVGSSKKNYNSETGLPLTLLSFDEDMEVGVLEMGMDGPGQIERLAEIARPTCAIITNIGISHIERLGSRENIMKAKMEIAENFDVENTLVLNIDDDMLALVAEEEHPYKVVTVGTSEKAEYQVLDIEDRGYEGISFALKCPGYDGRVDLNVPGCHNALNCGLAIAGAVAMGAKAGEAVDALANMETTGSRMRLYDEGDIKIIDDAYNAAPVSMRSAVEMLCHSTGDRRVAILGGMNELGKLSDKEHFALGEFIAESGPEVLVTIGDMAKEIQKGYLSRGGKGKHFHFDVKEELADSANKIFKSGDVVLLKASRSFELEELVPVIEAYMAGEK